MSQVVMNVLTIFVFPCLLGIGLRMAFFKFKKGFVVTAVAAVLSLIMLILAFTINTHGDETMGLLNIMSLLLFAGSAVCEAVLLIVRRSKAKK